MVGESAQSHLRSVSCGVPGRSLRLHWKGKARYGGGGGNRISGRKSKRAKVTID